VENEGNEYLVSGPRKTMISVPNELNGNLKEVLKGEVLKGEHNFLEHNFKVEIMEKLKENIQKQLKEYQGKTNKVLEKTQKQLNELREDVNKL
jgi:hypothetical protein